MLSVMEMVWNGSVEGIKYGEEKKTRDVRAIGKRQLLQLLPTALERDSRISEKHCGATKNKMGCSTKEVTTPSHCLHYPQSSLNAKHTSTCNDIYYMILIKRHSVPCARPKIMRNLVYQQ